ncbi:MAG: hypothetical protein O9264_03950 [Leptospira sp.]|jgi:hypothetical protein|nr:hypothetical protein [Leptospira sp.]
MKRSLLIFSFSLFLISLLNSNCKLADLRPTVLTNSGNNPDLKKKALQIISNPSETALKPAQWKDYKKIQFTLTDVWHSKLTKFFTPIKDDEQRMNVFIDLEKSTMEVELLNGVNKGLVLGLSKKDVYQISADTGKVFTGDDEVRIYLESLRLYLMLVWKMQEFEILQYAGDSKLHSKDYNIVYATSVQVEATPDTDQYIAYYEKDSGALEWIEFTYREVFIWYRGVLKFGHYEQWDGKMFPRRISILDSFDATDFVHEIRIEKIEKAKKPLAEEQIIQEQN